MKYCIEIVRDGSGAITARNILYASPGTVPLPRGKECVLIDGPNDESKLGFQKVSVDQDGNLFVEDDPDKIAKQQLENAIALRIKRQDFGRRLIAIITIRNDVKNLTSQQEEQIATSFASINSALLNGRIDNAKADIQAIVPDGTLVTQADIDAILAEIVANEPALGY